MVIVKITVVDCVNEISAVLGQFEVEISSPAAESGRTAFEPPQTPPFHRTFPQSSFSAVSEQQPQLGKLLLASCCRDRYDDSNDHHV